MKKRIIFFLFVLCAAGQLYLSVSSIINKENILKNGAVHKFRTMPVDPYDPFRGKYVALDFENSVNVSRTDDYEEGLKVFVLLEKDIEGFSYLSSVSNTQPDNNNYLKLKIDYMYDDQLYFELPFDRYYLDENFAKEAESAYWDESGERNTYIIVRVLSGSAVLEELFIHDVPVMEYLKARRDSFL